MLIRKATQKDIPSIINLDKLWFKEGISWGMKPQTSDNLKKLFTNKKKHIYILEEKNKSIGYLLGEIVKSTKSMSSLKIKKGDIYGEISDVYVVKKHRGKGYGDALVKEFLSECKSSKVKLVKLRAVSKDLFGLVKYYKRFGFAEKSVLMVLEKI